MFIPGRKSIVVSYCACEDAHQVLMRHGLFAFSPVRPQTAMAIVLLDFYRCLFERSADAVHAWAAALHTHYRRCGFRLQRTACGPTVGATYRSTHETVDPFRKGLSEAIQWLDALRIHIEQDLEAIISTASQRVKESDIPMNASIPISVPQWQPTSVIGPLGNADRHQTEAATTCLQEPEASDRGTHCASLLPPLPRFESSCFNAPVTVGGDRPELNPAGALCDERLVSSPAPGLSGIASGVENGCTAGNELFDKMPNSTSANNQHTCSDSGSDETLYDGQCDRYLQSLCPACFGGSKFGRSLSQYVFRL
jgi:hypothetical protein